MSPTVEKTEVEFMGIPFWIDPRVLTPRPETELLVETGLSILRTGRPPHTFGEPPRPRTGQAGEGPSVIDVGTGSGCIAISLAVFEPSIRVIATDLSPEALEVARENARHHGVLGRIDFRQGDLFSVFGNVGTNRFDLIVSNPPYVAIDEWSALPLEVRREPRMALWGGQDGLETIDRLIHSAPAHLNIRGWLALEIGYRQSAAAQRKLKGRGFKGIAVLKDFSGIERIVAAQYG